MSDKKQLIEQDGIFMRCPHCEFVIEGAQLTMETGKDWTAYVDHKSKRIVLTPIVDAPNATISNMPHDSSCPASCWCTGQGNYAPRCVHGFDDVTCKHNCASDTCECSKRWKSDNPIWQEELRVEAYRLCLHDDCDEKNWDDCESVKLIDKALAKQKAAAMFEVKNCQINIGLIPKASAFELMAYRIAIVAKLKKSL